MEHTNISENRTCRMIDWNTGQPCGAKTTSRNERFEHIRMVHTPSAAQWTEAYRKIEASRKPKHQADR